MRTIFLTACAAIFVTSSLIAADAVRQIDFTAVLTDPDDAPITVCADQVAPKDEAECKTHRPVTLGFAAMKALVTPEQNATPETAFKRGQLALMVYKSSAAQLTVDELKMIKDAIAKTWGPLVVARAFPLLDPALALMGSQAK